MARKSPKAPKAPKAPKPRQPRILAHTDCTPLEMAIKNLANAERALAMLSMPDVAGMCPHPAVIVRAEIANARRHLALAQ